MTWFDLSPKGDRVAIVTRGEIFSVPVKKGITLPVSGGSGARESWASFDPDSKRLIYVSDVTHEEAIHSIDAWLPRVETHRSVRCGSLTTEDEAVGAEQATIRSAPSKCPGSSKVERPREERKVEVRSLPGASRDAIDASCTATRVGRMQPGLPHSGDPSPAFTRAATD